MLLNIMVIKYYLMFMRNNDVQPKRYSWAPNVLRNKIVFSETRFANVPALGDPFRNECCISEHNNYRLT